MNIDASSAVTQAISSKTSVFGSIKNMSPEKADAVSKDFESLFISQMVQQMFGESSGSEAFGSEDTDEVYKGLMVQEYGKIIQKNGGIGIASNIYKELTGSTKTELLKQQEVKGN